ncbi:MAG: hypothetical protein ACAI38_23215 [Myxococcota bacterium]
MSKRPPKQGLNPGKQPGTGNQPVGADAFGKDPKGAHTGSMAFGEGDTSHPLRGALLFGNDPKGAPRGSESFGGPDAKIPLRGALLFGNDPKGKPRGSEAFGGSDSEMPLRGALLFGNDPQGSPRGSDAFGNDTQLATGSAAFGASQLVPDRLFKDQISYDFGGVLLAVDTEGLAGIRKDPRDRLRERVLSVLQRRLHIDPQRLRHGLTEDSVPWGRMKRDDAMDKQLVEQLRAWWKVAPGHVLGIGHARDILENMERMHTFELRCEWDARPVRLSVLDPGGEAVAYADGTIHKEHEFLVFRTPEKLIFAYVDMVVPRQNAQTARVRNADGSAVGTFELTTPAVAESATGKRVQLKGTLRDSQERVAFRLVEERSGPKSFLANLLAPDTDDKVGRIEDKMSGGKIRTIIEVDLAIPRLLTWAVGALMADLARLRRAGWPDAPSSGPEEQVESIEEALGPRRRR